MEALDEYIATRFGGFRARGDESPLRALRGHLDEVVEESMSAPGDRQGVFS